MAKTGRNDPCPCGSGNKYKKCCLTNDEAADRERLAESRSERDERAAEHQLQLQEFNAAIAAMLAGNEEVCDDADDLTDASNAVLDLVRAGKLDEAEAAARDLLARYPDTHDGYDRLGLVHEARGENRQAADCYRKVIAFLRLNPDYADAGFRDMFAERIAKLDLPPVS
jgi:tetratricopeptide (TPR) repeat protein